MSSEIAGMFLRQNNLFISILRDVLELSDTSISPEDRKLIRKEINSKIEDYLDNHKKYNRWDEEI